MISPYGKGLTTSKAQAHLAEIYDTDMSRKTIPKNTESNVADVTVWQNRTPDAAHAVLGSTQSQSKSATRGPPTGSCRAAVAEAETWAAAMPLALSA